MSIKKGLFGAIGLSLLAIGLQLPVKAQTQTAITAEPAAVTSIVSEPTVDNAVTAEAGTTDDEFTLADLVFSEQQTEASEQAEIPTSSPAATTGTMSLDALIAREETSVEPVQPVTEAAELVEGAEETEEIAQIRRRRTRGGAATGANYIGIGADFGYSDDIGFAAISKFSFSEQFAVRPTVIIGDDFSILVPITYDFSRFNTDISGFQLRPYAGAGASFSDSDNDSDLNLLLSAGVDVPVSERFTGNAQVNFGVLNDSQFGVTVGVGYNFGSFF